jgi:hypothetical protein
MGSGWLLSQWKRPMFWSYPLQPAAIVQTIANPLRVCGGTAGYELKPISTPATFNPQTNAQPNARSSEMPIFDLIQEGRNFPAFYFFSGSRLPYNLIKILSSISWMEFCNLF